ncbi:MAG: MurR/RpiR family transcriptional regulator [Ruminococcaceae bacterium]|nr:MurR/RpiR family transcriptional regulator [Oscillospiraceae bacterium]
MFDYEVIQSLNELEMLVYNYITAHKQEVKYMTVRELADSVHVSTSTVMRFCKKNGCDGYSEFRMKFKMFLSEEKKKQPQNAIDEITHFFQTVSTPAFENNLSVISTVLKNAKQVIFIGIGTSGHLGKYGARYFSNLGKFSQYIEDPYYPIGTDMDSTAVVALSVRGETPEIIKLAELFKMHGCKIISITNKSSCTLAKISDYNISYYVTENMVDNEYNITTQVPVVYLIETLGKMFL